MISNLLNLLERGLYVMRSSSHMLLVGILVFVFPLLFVWITQNFFTTAYDNIDTAQKLRVGIIHDSITSVIKSVPNYTEVTADMALVFSQENTDITKIRVVEKDDKQFLILTALEASLVNTYETASQPYLSLPGSAVTNPVIFPITVDGTRVWQVFSIVELGDKDLYVFTEHSFALVDSVMSARQQQSYLGLTAIFLFLIVLAYWLNRQVYWKKQHHKLQEQLKERDLFSNMIAHEFRSPLTAIKGYASFLQESKTLSEEDLRFATNIRFSAERLVTLVSDFLEVARLQAGKMEIANQELDLRNIITSVTEDLQVMANEKNLKLVYNPEPKLLLMTTDSLRMTQVLTNIISNAIKYTDSGMVELVCEQKPGEITVRVKDTGTGISAADQKKLFTPFSRVGDVDSGSVVGTGLGMWITKQLVALLDGSIGVESIQGVGTHVVIRFDTN